MASNTAQNGNEWLWEAQYAGTYAKHSKKKQYKRQYSRNSAAKNRTDATEKTSTELEERFEREIKAHHPNAFFWHHILVERSRDPDAKRLYRAELQAERHAMDRGFRAERAAQISRRLVFGLMWNGGAVGGNPEYQQPPFHLTGLVSEGHPILQLFASKLPRAPGLKHGGTKSESLDAPYGSKLLALDAEYIDANKAMRGVLRVEVDRSFDPQQIRSICEQAKVPLPNLAVGFRRPDGTLMNPHLIWLLHDSVAFTRKGKPKFKLLFEGVLRGLTAALRPFGADAGGLQNAMRLKNPLSPKWSREFLATMPYTLSQLAAHVDTTLRVRRASEGTTCSSPETPTTDRPHSGRMNSSNAFFHDLTTWARSAVREAKQQGMMEDDWRAQVLTKAMELGYSELQSKKRTTRSIQKTAYNVAAWNWKHIAASPPASTRQTKLTPQEVAERRAAAGRLTANERADRSRQLIISTLQELQNANRPVTQMEVHRQLTQSGTPLAKRTIERHWSSVLNAE